MKKAQITLFLIITIFIISIIVLFVYFNKKNENAPDLNDPEVAGIYDFLLNCFKTTSEEGLFYISERGGFYEEPAYSTETGIPYYLYNENDYTPSLNTIESELSRYIQKNLYLCVYFSGIENAESVIPKVRSKIYNNNVAVNIDYEIFLKKESKSFKFSNFKFEINSDLYNIYNNITNLLNEDKKNPNSICLSCIINISKNTDYKIKMFDYGNNTIIFSFEDLDIEYNNETFKFNYANKYRIKTIKELMKNET